MGSMVEARCECGLHVPLGIGGGFLNFMTTCYFPCICHSCSSVVEVDVLEEAPHCPNCKASNPVPYDDPSVPHLPGQHSVACWSLEHPIAGLGSIQQGDDLPEPLPVYPLRRDHVALDDGRYLCPQCGRTTLRFEFTGNWD